MTISEPRKPFAFPGRNPYRNDPDETEGRKLYRGRANAEARMSIGLARTRKVKLK